MQQTNIIQGRKKGMLEGRTGRERVGEGRKNGKK